MIYFHCPDFYNGFEIYQGINILKHEAANCFNDDVQIGSIFGAFPSMIWNGGTFDLGRLVTDLRDIEYIADMYQGMGFPINFTFTNGLLIDTDCFDRYCNKILDIFNNRGNGILVNSECLEKYLREKYPNYRILKSITSTEQDFDIHQAVINYDQIVLPKRHNKNFDLLNQITPEDRPNIEILVNEICREGCPRAYSHYLDYNRVQLYEECLSDKLKCSFMKPIFPMRNNNNIITFQDIIDKYYPLGYNQFKIGGRGYTQGIGQAINVVRYLIKPEYQVDVLEYLLK